MELDVMTWLHCGGAVEVFPNFDFLRMTDKAYPAQALLRKRALQTRSLQEQQDAAAASEPLARCLGPVDVLLLGLGSILGAGAFVLTGVAAHEHAGCCSLPQLALPSRIILQQS